MPALSQARASARGKNLKYRNSKGFALVFCLALLALIFALVIGLTSLVTLELRHTQMRQEMVLSKIHTQFGLGIALGDLKRHLGPDQKISATAEILEEGMDSGSLDDGRRFWTGVWDTKDMLAEPVWLISDKQGNPYEAMTSGSHYIDQAVLVGRPEDGSLASTVRLGKVEVEQTNAPGEYSSSENEASGSYAYWIGDEGVKAKINMSRGEDALNATGFGVSAIPGLEALESKLQAEELKKILDVSSLAEITKAADKEVMESLFHEVTVHGQGVLSNVKEGGLRGDLTAGLQPDARDSEGKPVLTGKEQIFGPAKEESASYSRGGGFVPGRGFPELQGYELFCNIRRTAGGGWRPGTTRRPLDPTSPYADLVSYSPTYYSLLVEDLNDFDWDLRLDVMRLSDGNILLTLHYNSPAGFNHTIMDNKGNPLPGLLRCHYSQWRRGKVYSTIIQCGTEDVNIDPGGPLWDQLRDYYNLGKELSSSAGGNSISPRLQTEEKVGVHPVITRAQFFLYPTYQKQSNGRYKIYSHVLPALVLWNPHDVDLSPSKYTVGLWNREQFGFGDKYRIYYNDRNVCEKNYYRWHPRKPGGPEGGILDQRKANVDIKGPNPEPGYPTSRWPYINTDGNIGVDLIACRPGRIWTYMDTVPGETYEVKFPFGINRDGGRKKRRGIVSWDGTDMATFEGDTKLFRYGAPQDYVTFTAVATSNRTRLEFRSGNQGGCQGATIGVCTVKSTTGYPASVKVPTKFPGYMNKKIGFVLDNVSGLKAGEALVFTPAAESRYAEYSIGNPPGNLLKEGWHGGHTFWKPTDKSFDADAKPTHGEVILDSNDTYLALFHGAVDTDSSYNEPLVLLSMGRFQQDQGQPEQFPLLPRKTSGRYGSSQLVGAVGRRFKLRFSADDEDSYESGRIRWLANYNPRASIMSPTPYEFSSDKGHRLTGSLQTIPNYQTDQGKVSDNQWDVPVSGSASQDNPFVAYSHQTGVTRGPLFEIPKGYDQEHFRSLAQFSHVDFSTKAHRLIREFLTFEIGASYEKYAMRGLGNKPSYAAGNSLADPRIPLDATHVNLSSNPWIANEARLDAGYHYDHSYLLNEALWDKYFLSTIPRATNARQINEQDLVLPNSRLRLRSDPLLIDRRAKTVQATERLPFDQAFQVALERRGKDLLAYDMAASLLMIDGAFNVNSTSVKAWAALLGSFFGAKVTTKAGGRYEADYESPFLRMNQPHGPAVKAGDGTSSSSGKAYTGFRTLSQAEIDSLAQEIVKQVKNRGPFDSIAAFVNRTLPKADLPSRESDWQSSAMKGALASAIESAGINDHFMDEKVLAESHENLDQSLAGGVNKPGGAMSSAGSAASHAPGFLSQADLLSRLGPCLSARSDTFRVRVFGESFAPSSSGQESSGSHARCEAIFQRLPEALEPDKAISGSSGNKSWNGLYRKFALVGFRWLTDNEI